MSRLDRRNRTNADMGMKLSGGLTDLIDDIAKALLRINDAEYDFICANITDSEFNLFIADNHSISDKKEMLKILDKLLIKFETR